MENYKAKIDNWVIEHRHLNKTGLIDQLIKTVETDTNLADVFIRKFLLSMIAVIYGDNSGIVLVFHGEQLTGKSEWFRRLLPTDLRDFYGETPLHSHYASAKECQMLMCSKLILVSDEMHRKSTDLKLLKSLVTKSEFTLRPLYSQDSKSFKRLSMIAGTSNYYDLKSDSDSDFILVPINVKYINHELYNSIDKDALFMELWNEYSNGAEYSLTPSEIAVNIVNHELKQK